MILQQIAVVPQASDEILRLGLHLFPDLRLRQFSVRIQFQIKGFRVPHTAF